jgi:hypothetical protein
MTKAELIEKKALLKTVGDLFDRMVARRNIAKKIRARWKRQFNKCQARIIAKRAA